MLFVRSLLLRTNDNLFHITDIRVFPTMSATHCKRLILATVASVSVLMNGCVTYPEMTETPSYRIDSEIPVDLSIASVLTQDTCEDVFHRYLLNHETTAPNQTVAGFDANGSGIAAGDLDQDGLLDLVIGGYAQPNSIFWNNGNLEFDSQPIGDGLTREVQLVDVDGDQRLDIATTRRGAGIAVWRNTGSADRTNMFERLVLPGIDRPLYSMDWWDVDGDGDLDLGAATYDAELKDLFGSEFLINNSGGVYLFSLEEGKYHMQQLAQSAQGLATLFLDVTGDQAPEMLIGNDFATPDFIFQQQNGTWTSIEPFTVTTHSTMSLAAGDINNDGTRICLRQT